MISYVREENSLKHLRRYRGEKISCVRVFVSATWTSPDFDCTIDWNFLSFQTLLMNFSHHLIFLSLAVQITVKNAKFLCTINGKKWVFKGQKNFTENSFFTVICSLNLNLKHTLSTSLITDQLSHFSVSEIHSPSMVSNPSATSAISPVLDGTLTDVIIAP